MRYEPKRPVVVIVASLQRLRLDHGAAACEFPHGLGGQDLLCCCVAFSLAARKSPKRGYKKTSEQCCNSSDNSQGSPSHVESLVAVRACVCSG